MALHDSNIIIILSGIGVITVLTYNVLSHTQGAVLALIHKNCCLLFDVSEAGDNVM